MCPVQPPRFEFYDPHSPIYTSPRFLPPAKIVKSKVSDAIISHGAYLEECTVENAIIGLRARIGKKTVIRVRGGWSAEHWCPSPASPVLVFLMKLSLACR